MEDFLSLVIAKVTPMDRHVGSAGGTVIVMRSRLLKKISRTSRYPSLKPLNMNGNATMNPRMEMQASTAMNFSESA